eukprot:c24600_g1_i10 orf=591-1082(+)
MFFCCVMALAFNSGLRIWSAVGFLELLGILNKLKAASPSYFCSPCLNTYIAEGIIPAIHATEDLNTTATLFTSLPPSSSIMSQNSSVIFDAILEPGPLKRAEWIKFLAPFFDLEERANFVYQQIERNYQCLNASSKDALAKPLVAWISYNAGVWAFSNDQYRI